MKAPEIMTRGVIAVTPDTPVRDVAKLMVDQRISGVPVIDDGKLVGIVSENDLVRRVELGREDASTLGPISHLGRHAPRRICARTGGWHGM